MKKYSFVPGVALAALFSLCLIQAVAAASNDNLYKVFIGADGVTTNDFGRLAGVFASNREFIRKCATENGISNVNNLTLIYDREADALEVVNRTTGELICTPLVFSGGLSLTNASQTTRERLAFVYLEGNGEAVGTLKGTERSRYDFDGNLFRFNLTAKLQFAAIVGGTRSKIYSAFLTTGARFVPSAH